MIAIMVRLLAVQDDCLNIWQAVRYAKFTRELLNRLNWPVLPAGTKSIRRLQPDFDLVNRGL